MNTKNAEFLLAAVIMSRASSLLLSHIGLGGLSVMNLLGLRFMLAFVLLALLFHKRLAQLHAATVLRGAALGCVFFALMVTELNGLKRTDSSTTSFLENTAIVLVTLFEALLHRRAPAKKSLLSALLALLGVSFLTLRGAGLHLGTGELLCLLAACFYASAIILTDRLSKQDDPLLIGIVQVGTIGILALGGCFLFETPRLPQSGTEWAVVAALAVVCSCFGFTLQPVAQKHLSAERAGVFCALNPLTAVVLGVCFLHEGLTATRVIGMALLLCGILVPRLEFKRLFHLSRRGTHRRLSAGL